MQELHRSSTDYILLGVCGGLGEYFHISSSFIRLLFIVFFFFGGASLLIYIALALIMPADMNAPSVRQSVDRIKETLSQYTKTPPQDAGINEHTTSSMQLDHVPGRVIAGIVLFFFGIYALLQRLGIVMNIDMGIFVPLLLILLGIVLFFKQKVTGNTIMLIIIIVFIITAIASLSVFHY